VVGRAQDGLSIHSNYDGGGKDKVVFARELT
jgi:hypothetical protein